MVGQCGLAIAFAASLLFPGTMHEWMQGQNRQSLKRLLANVSPEGARPGAIIASPSTDKPNYRFVWVRDAALVADVLITLYEYAGNPTDREFYFNIISQYIHLSRHKQLQATRSGMAEEDMGDPKFHVDGSAFWDDWGRPQDDGAALRASALIRFSNVLLQENRYHLVAQVLPIQRVIETDLRFVQKYWNRPSYDLWEEVKAKSHFYTRSVQEKAMLDGAKWEGNPTTAKLYDEAAGQIRAQINPHWVRRLGYIVSSRNIVEGVQNKTSGLDIETILTALHTQNFTDDRITATIPHLEAKFEKLYSINRITLDDRGQIMAPAIGRYPEDAYDDYKRDTEGHPWFLSTLAMAQYHYSLAEEYCKAGQIRVRHRGLAFFQRLGGTDPIGPTDILLRGSEKFNNIVKLLIERGDQYMRRVRYHSPKDGSLHEQFNRHHGYMQGARELTWSHAAFLTAALSRIAAILAFDTELKALVEELQ